MRICTIGGGSTGRRSLSPAPQARAAMGCCRMWRWYRDWVDGRLGGGGGGGDGDCGSGEW